MRTWVLLPDDQHRNHLRHHVLRDLKADGPTVIENPPESLCVVDDFWFRHVADLGLAGAGKGAGGKYLILPPGYEEVVPEGYFTYRSPTYTNWLVVRALGGVPALKTAKVDPLSPADDPPATDYLNIASSRHNTVHANDYSYFHEIDTEDRRRRVAIRLYRRRFARAVARRRAGLSAGRGRAIQRRRVDRRPFRAIGVGGRGVELDPNRAGQGVVRHAAAVRVVGSVVRPDLATRGDRAAELT